VDVRVDARERGPVRFRSRDPISAISTNGGTTRPRPLDRARDDRSVGRPVVLSGAATAGAVASNPSRGDSTRVHDTRPARATPALSPAIASLLLLACLVGSGCASVIPRGAPSPPRNELVVTATAYNSTVSQTDSDPTMTAHGVRITPGMQIIAVSRDLEAMGLSPGTRVRIEGLPGEWAVADRMAKRWRRRIDVYMGLDLERARRFGRRTVKVRWKPKAD
jgi:3D (Asp-Asp-Asp) domain-containing protein